MSDLPALLLFAFVSSVTPGPNNVLLWASGLRFGFRATVPQIVGTSAGIGILALAAAAGLGAIVAGSRRSRSRSDSSAPRTCCCSRSGSQPARRFSRPRSPGRSASARRSRSSS